MKKLLTFVYLLTIVLANLAVLKWGPQAVLWVGFLLVGLDFTSRDGLHDLWRGKNLWRNMFLLILTGSLITVVLNRGSLKIAIASTIAFLCAGIVDTLSYHFLRDKTKLIRINGSNVFSTLVDSFVFLTLAFGFPPMWLLVGKQFLVKVLGGFLWSLVLARWK